MTAKEAEAEGMGNIEARSQKLKNLGDKGGVKVLQRLVFSLLVFLLILLSENCGHRYIEQLVGRRTSSSQSQLGWIQ